MARASGVQSEATSRREIAVTIFNVRRMALGSKGRIEGGAWGNRDRGQREMARASDVQSEAASRQETAVIIICIFRRMAPGPKGRLEGGALRSKCSLRGRRRRGMARASDESDVQSEATGHDYHLKSSADGPGPERKT